jgi:hypothetical protein
LQEVLKKLPLFRDPGPGGVPTGYNSTRYRAGSILDFLPVKIYMKKLTRVLPLLLVLAACGSDDGPPKDDGIDQDSLHVMDNRQDRDNRNTTSYDSIPAELIKDSARPKE